MADARHFCPDCGGIDLQISRQFILLDEAEDTGATAKCPNCGWGGPLSKTVGAVTSEQFWDINRIGDVLLRVVSKHAAGPFIQVMEFVGLFQRPMTQDQVPADWTDADIRQHNELVATGREQVVKAMLAAAISAGFEEAEKVHRTYAVTMNIPLHPALQGDEVTPTQSFGGNVTPINRKKGKRRG